MAVTIKFKRGQSSSWTTMNLTLAPGEPGFELDTGRLKIGDGITPWNDLPYLGEDGNGVVSLSSFEDFPPLGDPKVIYKAEQEKQIYQWNAVSRQYERLGESGGTGSLDINIIYGGNANGTDNS